MGPMGKSKKRNKRKKTGSGDRRSMRPGRLSAVERIERARRTTPPAAASAAAAPAATNPAAGRIAEARRLGLSVADDASADKVDDLLERFAAALVYTRDVWGRLAPAADPPPERRLHRATARLFEDGRLAEQVVAAQRRRAAEAVPSPPHGPTRKAVATVLRREFDDLLPARSLLGRLLGR